MESISHRKIPFVCHMCPLNIFFAGNTCVPRMSFADLTATLTWVYTHSITKRHLTRFVAEEINREEKSKLDNPTSPRESGSVGKPELYCPDFLLQHAFILSHNQIS